MYGQIRPVCFRNAHTVSKTHEAPMFTSKRVSKKSNPSILCRCISGMLAYVPDCWSFFMVIPSCVPLDAIHSANRNCTTKNARFVRLSRSSHCCVGCAVSRRILSGAAESHSLRIPHTPVPPDWASDRRSRPWQSTSTHSYGMVLPLMEE